MVTEGPVVGVSRAAAPHSDRDTAAMVTGSWGRHTAVRSGGGVLQAGDEVADGAVAVSPTDEFTQTVGGCLNRVGHGGNLEEK